MEPPISSVGAESTRIQLIFSIVIQYINVIYIIYITNI